MKKHFNIIMQLHAEDGGASAPAPAESAPVASEPAAPAATPAPANTTPAPAPAAQSTQAASPAPAATPVPAPAPEPKPDYKVIATAGTTQLIEDANGLRRIIDVNQQQQAEPAQAPVPGTGTEPQTQPANPDPAAELAPVPGTEQPAAPAPLNTQPQPLPVYTPQELSLAIQMGIVDESRIPPSLAIQYGQFKEKQAQQMAIAANQQQAQQTPQPNEAQQRMEFLEKIEKTSRELTMQQLGLTEQDLADRDYADYSDNPDLEKRVKAFEGLNAYNRQQIINDVQAQQAKAAQQAAAQKAVNDSILSFAQNEIRTEPKFTEINNALETYYQSLPYAKGAKYAEALNAYKAGTATEAQANVLKEYYDETKRMIYAKANNLSTTPTPVVRTPARVESPGTGLDTPRQADPTELRGLDYMGKIAWLAKNTK